MCPIYYGSRDLKEEDISSVGGKGASLGEMASIGLPVPRNLWSPPRRSGDFVETGLDQKIFKVSENIDVENNAVEKAAETIKALVIKAKMPSAIKDDVSFVQKDGDKRPDRGRAIECHC